MRFDFAKELEHQPLAQDAVVIPDDFPMNWERLMKKARKNLWNFQNRFDCYPNWQIEIKITDSLAPNSTDNSDVYFWFDMADQNKSGMAPLEQKNNVVKYELPKNIMLMSLLGAANWNNLEVGALVKIFRHPDIYETDIYQLMSFFTL